MSPTRTEIPRLLSERNTAQNNVFLQVFFLHLDTGWYNIGPALVDTAIQISWRTDGSGGGHPDATKIQRRTGQWSWIPGMDGSTIPGNSQLGQLVLPIPREWLEGPRGLVFLPGWYGGGP